jgi:hypothetical protein
LRLTNFVILDLSIEAKLTSQELGEAFSVVNIYGLYEKQGGLLGVVPIS